MQAGAGADDPGDRIGRPVAASTTSRSCARCEDEGIEGVICGRAIYEGTSISRAARRPRGATNLTRRPHAPIACSPNASSPASTSPAAASSRASTSSSCATPATRSRSPRRYDEQGADELTFLDITATSDERDLILHIIEAVASQVFIPLTVGGGVRTVDDVRRLLNAGADKVSINTAAVANPRARSRRLGTSTARSASSSRSTPSARADGDAAGWEVYTPRRPQRTPGSTPSNGRARWRARGAGEILLTSMDRDGTKTGFDLALTRAVSRRGAGAGDRLGRRRQPASTWPTASSRAAPTRCWPPASSTTASTRSARPRRCMADARHPGAPERAREPHQYGHELARRSQVGRARPGAGDRAGSGDRRRADVRLDEPRGAGARRSNWARGVLQPLAQQAVVQGRGVRPRAAGARDPPRLRRRRACC